MRFLVVAIAAFLGLSLSTAPNASAGPEVCDYPDCTPGIAAHMVLGAPCENTTFYVFATADYEISFATQPGRMMFCGSPRRYEPRWFRSPPMVGIKKLDDNCTDWPEYNVAQGPDGMFLVCVGQNGTQSWQRGDT